jgi:L-rhamnose mutarotase
MTLRGITMGLFATVLFAGTIAVLVAAFAEPRVQRFGQIIGLKPEKVEEYKKLHAAVWPSVLKKIKECHIRN